MSVISGIQSCVATMMEPEDEGQNLTNDEVERVCQEGLRLKKKVKDLTRMLHETEERRFSDRREYEKIVRDAEAKLDNIAATHALDIQELRDAQAVELHDLLKQLLDSKTTLARKSSDVEELSKILGTIDAEQHKREEYYQKCLKELVEAHEVDKAQLIEKSRQSSDESWLIQTKKEDNSSCLLREEIKALQATLERERGDKADSLSALVALRSELERADSLLAEMRCELESERLRAQALDLQVTSLLNSRAQVVSAVDSVKKENERLSQHVRFSEPQYSSSWPSSVPGIGMGGVGANGRPKAVSLSSMNPSAVVAPATATATATATAASSNSRFPVHPPPPVPTQLLSCMSPSGRGPVLPNTQSRATHPHSSTRDEAIETTSTGDTPIPNVHTGPGPPAPMLLSPPKSVAPQPRPRLGFQNNAKGCLHHVESSALDKSPTRREPPKLGHVHIRTKSI